MPEDRQQTRFTLADLGKPIVRDKDNAMPHMKPPTMVRIQSPSLAPPGMSGVKTQAQRFTLAGPEQPVPRAPVALGDKDQARRAFQPLARTPPGKDLDRSR